MRRAILLVCVLALAIVVAVMPLATAAQDGQQVTIDFTTFGTGTFDPLFYSGDGIIFPAQRCGPAGCDDWFVGFVQGDEALIGNALLGPVTATFVTPISDLSLQVAPGSQGTATYTLTAYKKSDKVLGTQSLTVTQDSGDPDTGPFGYFTLSLSSLKKASRFTLDSVFVRSSFGITNIEYGVSSIHFITVK
jgi:hypothetical protein